MRRTSVLTAAIAALVVALATGCVPKNPGPTGLYLGQQANITPVVTPKASPVTWGHAPVTDPHYGGVLYEGTGIEQQDPRPAARNGEQPLRLWVADPDDGRTNRPAIIWIHGGGFAKGIDSMHGLAAGTGAAYAKRGYVGFSIEYRMDTTVVGTGAAPTSLCQWVQDNIDEQDPLWQERREQCATNITAAKQDALAAIRWVKANAARYGVDPNRVAVGGFSAGAVLAADSAFEWDDVGTESYWPGDPRTALASKPRATFGASGCTYDPDFGVPRTIGPGDAPTSFIASELDPAVPYECVKATFATARARGLVAELASYCNQAGHANALYLANKAATDTQWTRFLTREMGLYTGMPAYSPTAFC